MRTGCQCHSGVKVILLVFSARALKLQIKTLWELTHPPGECLFSIGISAGKQMLANITTSNVIAIAKAALFSLAQSKQ